ncbi:hypothetical protein D3C76_1332400 [compost metagenome]
MGLEDAGVAGMDRVGVVEVVDHAGIGHHHAVFLQVLLLVGEHHTGLQCQGHPQDRHGQRVTLEPCGNGIPSRLDRVERIFAVALSNPLNGLSA